MSTMYFAQVEGFINGRHRAKGDEVGCLSEREAKYLEMSGAISRTPPDATPLPAERPPVGKTTQRRQAAAAKREPDPSTLERKTR